MFWLSVQFYKPFQHGNKYTTVFIASIDSNTLVEQSLHHIIYIKTHYLTQPIT